eukprot:3751001-Prymnesium_polylepis.2
MHAGHMMSEPVSAQQRPATGAGFSGKDQHRRCVADGAQTSSNDAIASGIVYCELSDEVAVLADAVLACIEPLHCIGL